MTQAPLSEERIEHLKEWKKDSHGGAKLRAQIDGDCRKLEADVNSLMKELAGFQEWYDEIVSALNPEERAEAREIIVGEIEAVEGLSLSFTQLRRATEAFNRTFFE